MAKKNKPDYWYNQSSVIPFIREDDGEIKLVLITSRRRKRWIFPKGIVESDMTAQDSAAKEALEEAGLTGFVLADEIASYEYTKWGSACKVKLYLMEVSEIFDTWAESGFRQRKIVGLKKAAGMLELEPLKKIIPRIPEILNLISV